MLCSRNSSTRFTLLSLVLIAGVFSGGCSTQREAILSKLELDRLFHRVDVAADRADRAQQEQQEQQARDRMVTSYWGRQSSTLEREVARPDPGTATSSDDLMRSRPGATPIEMKPVARTATPHTEPGSGMAVSSPSPRTPQAEGQMPSPPPPPKLVELPVPPRPATSGFAGVQAAPVAPVVSAGDGIESSVSPSEPPAGGANGGEGIPRTSFYGVASDPAELLESGDKPPRSGSAVVAVPGAGEESSLVRPAHGSLTLQEGPGKAADTVIGSEGAASVPMPVSPPRGMVASVVTGPVPSTKASESNGGDSGEKEDWADLISSIRPFSNRAPAVEAPVGE